MDLCTSSTSSSPIAPRYQFDSIGNMQRCGRYSIGKTIGKGNFAIVAIKIVDRRALDSEAAEKLTREIQILKRLEHPHVVRLYEVMQSDTHTYLVTQLVTNGELFSRLIDKGKYPEPDARRIFRQLTSALAYCHANGVVHRDLKSENVLLDENDNIVLIDFGFSTNYRKDNLLETWCGSPPYAAPELHMAQPYDGTKTDVWSLGVMLYIIVCGGFPFPGDSVATLKRHILNNSFGIPWWVSVECADLIRKMLVISPDKRFSITQITQHKWFMKDRSVKEIQLLSMSLAGKSIAHSFYEDGSRLVRQRSTSGDDTLSMNQTILHYMQTEGVDVKQNIMASVKLRSFDSNHGTYQMLVDKLKTSGGASEMNGLRPIRSGKQLHQSNSSTCLVPPRKSPPRRGSITTGIAAPATADQSPKGVISVSDLAKLQLGAGPSTAIDASSGSETDEPVKHTRFMLDVNDEVADAERRNITNRRHTLGPLTTLHPPHVIVNAAPATTFQPTTSTAFYQPQQSQQLPPGGQHVMDTSQGHLANAATPYPLHLYNDATTMFANPVTLVNQVDQLNALYAQALTCGADAWGNNYLSPNRGASSMRRASDGSNALASQMLSHLTHIADRHMINDVTVAQPSAPSTIEEQGAGYLARSRKRRTTLDTIYGQPPQQQLSAESTQPRRRRHLGGSITQGTSSNAASRRASSPLTHISQHDLGVLQTLHQQAVIAQRSGGEGGSINNLQREFEELNATNGTDFVQMANVPGMQLSPSSAVGRLVGDNPTPLRVQSPTPQLQMIIEQVDVPMETVPSTSAMNSFYAAAPNNTVVTFLSVDDVCSKVTSLMREVIALDVNYENRCGELGVCLSFISHNQDTLVDVIVHGDQLGQSRFDIVNVVAPSHEQRDRLVRDITEAMRRNSPPLASCARVQSPTVAANKGSPSPVQP